MTNPLPPIAMARKAIIGSSQIHFCFDGFDDARGMVIAKCVIDEDPIKSPQWTVGLKVLLHYPKELNGRLAWCWWEKTGGSRIHFEDE